MNKRNLVFILLLASAFSNHAMAMRRRQYELHHAASVGDTHKVQELIDAGHDVNEKIRHRHGYTPLHLAVRGDNVQVVRIFLEDSRTDPNIQDEFYNTPLHLAAGFAHTEIVRIFLEDSRTDPHIQDQFGLTLIHLAVNKKNPQLTRTLLEDGRIDPNTIPNRSRYTPLHMTVQDGDTEITRILLEAPRTDPHIPDDYTPLHLAVGQVKIEGVALLCGIHEKALEQIENLSADNLERFFWKEDLLLSYDLKTLEKLRRENKESGESCRWRRRCFTQIRTILDAAIDYKINFERQMALETASENERLAFVRTLSSQENISILSTAVTVLTGGATRRLHVPTFSFYNFAQAAAVAEPAAHALGAAGGNGPDGEEEGEEEGEVTDTD